MASTLAYIDSFLGLVPCRVEGIVYDSGRLPPVPDRSDTMLVVTVTANRGPYLRGEVLERSGMHVVLRERIRVRSGKEVIAPRCRHLEDHCARRAGHRGHCKPIADREASPSTGG